MNKAALLVLAAILLILYACAAPNSRKAESNLLTELKKWESFDSQGIAEVSYKGLSLRKMFSAAKNHGSFRLDVFDGGIMGVMPEPLISFYAGEYVTMRSTLFPMLEQMNPAMLVPTEGLAFFGDSDSLFAKHGAEIIETRTLSLGDMQISFLGDFRVDMIYDLNSDSEIQAKYNTNKSLSELVFRGADALQVKLIFDEINYIEPEITALPKPQGGLPGAGINPFQNMDIKQLLQKLLDNTR